MGGAVSHTLLPLLQKNAVAVAYAKRGKGVLRLNGALLPDLK